MIIVCERTKTAKGVRRHQPLPGWEYPVLGALHQARVLRQLGAKVWIEDTDAPASEVSRQYHARQTLRWLPPVDPDQAH